MKIFDPIPNVVLLGETNVGKSSLFNKMVGERVSLVGSQRDLTRDVIIKTSVTSNFNLVDLPGINRTDEIDHFIEKIPSVNAFLIVIDHTGWNDISNRFLKYAMNSGKKVLVLVNKSDLGHVHSNKNDMETRYISVLRNHGTDELNKYISSWFEEDEEEELKSISWGFVGRSNVGKSTLLNKLIGQERFLVKDEIGTTQEVNAVSITGKNKIFHMIDTPGYRKNTNLSDLEKASQYRLLKAINVSVSHFVVLIDITQGISRVDLLLMDKIWSRGKGLIVGIGMWDKMNSDLVVLSNAKKELKKRFHGVYCIAVSGITGYGINNLVNAMNEVETKMKKKVQTSHLNKWFASMKNTDAVNRSGIKYITQLGMNPPSFGLFSNRTIEDTRLRYLERKMIDHFDLQGVHLNLIVKHKKDK
ncbi:GTPase [Candidatus Cytomitobacter primus]|uniref:GTP-binding protein n=1 Tax=Candidatus Cytomitobacter primus TaxID=2066024 RepID=A0A5C0UFH9_9PROT|nr:GTPase [Candidatus Cytomitobacter primus]QEK38818.1 GTP-binding protein [Candidatus Cytomitobacter primus]